MPIAIDTSILVAAEKGGNFFDYIAALPGSYTFQPMRLLNFWLARILR